MYYLGIDGGGTKTAFALMNEAKEIISTYESGGCYYPTLGKEGIFNLLKEGIIHCTKEIDLSKVIACGGIPLYGESDNLMTDLEEIRERLPIEISFINDVEVGYYGALGFQAGINIVAGTGSIGIGFDESGNSARSGGFGPDLGCDEGSAHYIGRSLINKFTRQVDYREERTLLYEAIRKRLNLKDDLHVMSYFIEEVNMERDKIASFSVLANELALQGDEVCVKIFQDAAFELYLLAIGLVRQLSFEERPIKVSYTGGVFKSGELIFGPFEKLLKDGGMELVKPLNTPIYGACIKAKANAENRVFST